MRGGQGDDLFAINGLNLTALADLKLTGFEGIDLGGSGANTFTPGVREVFTLSPTSNTLTVLDADDFAMLGAG